MAKILVIDDEPGMRQVITKVLVPLGHQIFPAEEGAGGLEVCRTVNPDLALMDIRLPDMDGAEILADLKKIKPGMPVIILSGFGDIDAAVQLVRQGGTDYISKPFKINDFVNIVEKALTGRSVPVTGGATIKAAPPQSAPASPAPSTVPRKKSKLPFVLIAVAAAVIAAGGFGVWWWLHRPPPEAEFAVPYSNPAALSWDGKNLWAADWMAAGIYKHAADENLSVEAVYTSSDTAPVGVAFDGASLWTCNSFDQKIYQHRLTGSGITTVASYTSPGPSPSGLCFDGNNLWSLDFQTGKVYKHNSDASLSLAGAYDSPAKAPKGIFEHDGHFFILDAQTNRLFKINKETFSISGVYILLKYEDVKNHLSAVAFDGTSLWTCSEGTSKLFRHPVKTLKPVKF